MSGIVATGSHPSPGMFGFPTAGIRKAVNGIWTAAIGVIREPSVLTVFDRRLQITTV